MEDVFTKQMEIRTPLTTSFLQASRIFLAIQVSDESDGAQSNFCLVRLPIALGKQDNAIFKRGRERMLDR